MSQTGNTGALSVVGAGAERGTRRKKLAGYLKAANELRQSYQQSSAARAQFDGEVEEDDAGIPGAFPDVAIARNGDEEMVLFPSYARRHTKKPTPRVPVQPGIRDDNGSRDAEYWRREWEKYEDDNAIVDVDVRGWIYSPHRGPMTRKNRLLMGIARHLSGIPAPNANSQNPSRASSTHRDRAAEHEAELVEKEVMSITQRGRREADVAGRGGYSEPPGRDSDRLSLYSNISESRSPSPKPNEARPGDFPHPLTSNIARADMDNAPGPGGLLKRASWNQPADMSEAELAVANAHLMARLKPFLTNPLIGTGLTIFFYNDQTSQSRSTTTNEVGHFNFRAALDFIPTHIRVLANPNLSATEEVRITEPTGVSVISDIDDTIKHSSIGAGAKEIFRNTFIRDLGDLTIPGVREWYSKMHEMGVQLHYVSNSPWQLYPVLVSFFAMAGLPPGSFHLKQYTGMLQGIFEPVAERKKGTLDKIMHDFPERRFILIGDSGEADLELYSDVVLANPGRILGVFIRDVTTSPHQGFFDSSMGPLSSKRRSRSSLRRTGSRASLRRSGSKSSLGGHGERDAGDSSHLNGRTDQNPLLPPRPPLPTILSDSQATGPVMGNLIDFDEPDVEHLSSSRFEQDLIGLDDTTNAPKKSSPPRRPTKPLALRSASGEHQNRTSTSDGPTPNRKGPAPPPKPRRYSVSHESNQSPDPSPLSQTQNSISHTARDTSHTAGETTNTHRDSSNTHKDSSHESYGYRSAVRNKVASAYNMLPSPVAYWNGTTQSTPTSPERSRPDSGTTSTSTSTDSKPPPPVPPRRTLTSYPVAAAQYATHRLGYGSNEVATEDINGNPISPLNKKEELWKRRWARAKDILEDKGVILRSWRVGEDAMEDAVRLVERARREDEGGGPLPKWKSRP